VLQWRVVRAFKSTLEDMEERRSVHSLRSSIRRQSVRRPTSNVTYVDEDGRPSIQSSSPQGLLPGAAISSGEQSVGDQRNRPTVVDGVDSYATGADRDGHVGHHQQLHAVSWSADNNQTQLKSDVDGTMVTFGRTDSFGSNGGGQSVTSL